MTRKLTRREAADQALREDRIEMFAAHRAEMTQAALIAGQVRNEDGDLMVDFENRNRDSQDFATVSRKQLQAMLEHAYNAGLNARA